MYSRTLSGSCSSLSDPLLFFKSLVHPGLSLRETTSLRSCCPFLMTILLFTYRLLTTNSSYLMCYDVMRNHHVNKVQLNLLTSFDVILLKFYDVIYVFLSVCDNTMLSKRVEKVQFYSTHAVSCTYSKVLDVRKALNARSPKTDLSG